MRCFIAVDLPEEVKAHLLNLQKELGNDLIKIRWVAKKNLHLTLKFLGEVSEENIKIVQDKLSKIKFNSFKVRLGKIGVFPSENYIRVIWVGIEPDKDMITLQEIIDSSLLDLFKSEQRFETHLTLGRIKFVKDKEKFLDLLKKIKIRDMEFKVDNFKLMKSILTRNGPTYNALKEYILD
ncbi:MAG: RNA 2',3'-cyclic phosphodiesterase [Nanoarchaeota archaeon]